MSLAAIIFIGGFGASAAYSKDMCSALQRLTCRIVYNFPLVHGITLEDECIRVCEKLPDNTSFYILIGFSTGCVVATKLSVEYLCIEQLILVNPAEVLTRIDQNVLDSLIPPMKHLEYRNIFT